MLWHVNRESALLCFGQDITTAQRSSVRLEEDAEKQRQIVGPSGEIYQSVETGETEINWGVTLDEQTNFNVVRNKPLLLFSQSRS